MARSSPTSIKSPQRDILYAPDYVINAGGLITVSLGHLKKPLTEIRSRTLALEQTLLDLFERSQSENCPPGLIADRMAEDILFGSRS